MLSHPFRTFISYAHSDDVLVHRIIDALKAKGFLILWDNNLVPGRDFIVQLKSLISRAHFFMPVLTQGSKDRPWIHEEIGVAAALGIPIIPICVDTMPGEMISSVHAIKLKSDLTNFEDELNRVDFETILFPAATKVAFGATIVATFPEERVKTIADYAQACAEIGEYGLVRAQGKLPFFSIPEQDIHDEVWKRREEDEDRGVYFRHWQREQRLQLGEHAKKCGCKLIMDPYTTSFNAGKQLGRKTRLELVRDTLNMMNAIGQRVEIAIDERALETNLLIVGDHFYAESMASREGKGYFQTVVNSHAVSVLQKIRDFDKTYDACPRKDVSIAETVALLDEIIASIPS